MRADTSSWMFNVRQIILSKLVWSSSARKVPHTIRHSMFFKQKAIHRFWPFHSQCGTLMLITMEASAPPCCKKIGALRILCTSAWLLSKACCTHPWFLNLERRWIFLRLCLSCTTTMNIMTGWSGIWSYSHHTSNQSAKVYSYTVSKPYCVLFQVYVGSTRTGRTTHAGRGCAVVCCSASSPFSSSGPHTTVRYSSQPFAWLCPSRSAAASRRGKEGRILWLSSVFKQAKSAYNRAGTKFSNRRANTGTDRAAGYNHARSPVSLKGSRQQKIRFSIAIQTVGSFSFGSQFFFLELASVFWWTKHHFAHYSLYIRMGIVLLRAE